MKRLDGAKLEVPIKWGFYVYVAIFFALSVANPLYNWDMIGYVGAAKSMLRGAHASNHEYTYSLLQKTVPDRVFEELTTGERKAVTYDDPESFTQHLGFYRQRLMYVCLLAFVMFFNINPFVASHVISALCATMALWILGHMSQRPTSLGYLVAMAASLVSGLYITARYSTPDAMAALVFVALCWATVKHMKVALVLLPLSILVRFELPFGVYLFFFRDADRRAILASLAACIAVGVFVRTGVSGHSWLTVVGYTFKEHSAFPSTAHFEMSLAEYMQFLGSGFSSLLRSPRLLIVLFVLLSGGIVAIRRKWTLSGDRAYLWRVALLLFSALYYVLIHMIVFPQPSTRFFAAQYALILVLVADSVLGRRLGSLTAPAG